MINRTQALNFLNQQISNKNTIKHLLATEAMMRELAKKSNGNEEEWALAGLLHDADYNDSVPEERQGIEVTKILRDKGFEIPDNVAHAMAAHNWHSTGVEPDNPMDWSLFCGDSLTGLIVACALVRPDKKLASVTPEFVMKKFNEKSFAAGTRREDIALCEEKLGIPLPDFIETVLRAMQNISDELGL
ncbi:MAG: phosphohydrolase [Actinomycetota bacterium]|nr:phosphohydrolase [Actinomycetota bacterium]